MAYLRKIYISIDNLKNMCRDKQALDAYTFAVMLKARYTNSVMYGWSYRKVMQLCRCNFAKARQIVRDAMEMHLINEITLGRDGGIKCIIANRLCNSREDSTALYIAASPGMSTIYIETFNKTVKRGKEPVSKAEAKTLGMYNNWLMRQETKSYRKASRNKTPQTLSDVRTILEQYVLLLHLADMQGKSNEHKVSPMSSKPAIKKAKQAEARADWEREYASHGVSYESLSELFGHALSRYQVMQLMLKLCNDKLVKRRKAKSLFFQDEEELPDPDKCYVYNDSKGCEEWVFPRLRRDKFKKGGSWYLYYAYMYFVLAKVNVRKGRKEGWRHAA